jgi:hypothetical protein
MMSRKLIAAFVSVGVAAMPIGGFSLDGYDYHPIYDTGDVREETELGPAARDENLPLPIVKDPSIRVGVWNPDDLYVTPQPSQPPQEHQPPPPSRPPSRGDDKGSKWIGPAVLAGVAAVGLISAMMKAESKPMAREPDDMPDNPVRQLLEEGPQLPALFNTSAFAIRGLVRGGWPIVVDYETRSRGMLKLQVSARGTDIITFDLTKFGPGRHTLRFRLPRELGNGLKPGLVAFLATTPGSGGTIADFRLYGVGLGPKAVGSVAVDHLSFDPASIRTGRRQKAGYSFYSHSDFERVSVEFFRILTRNDGRGNERVDADMLRGGVRRDQWIDDPSRYNWDGLDRYGRASRGDHTLQVRAWTGSGDWVGAWSETLLTVRP